MDATAFRTWFALMRLPVAEASGARSKSAASCVWLGVGLGVCLFSLAYLRLAPAQTSQPAGASPVVAAAAEPITPVPVPSGIDPLKRALGEELFADPRLSHDQTYGCVSCHDVRTNGADNRRIGTGPHGQRLRFNTPTIFNAALSFRMNWDGRFRTLEQQAESSLLSPRIMATSLAEVLPRLNADPKMTSQFAKAYGRAPDRANVLDAIATYERSLLTPDSRFDKWLKGDTAALSPAEVDGYRLFKSLGCVSCHQGVNVGGNLFEHRGIFGSLGSEKPDLLRVPSLRNVATTAPYFHDGSAPTLDDAVRKMGRAQLGQTLSDPEVASIVGFLKTLTAPPWHPPREAKR
jgi:cytochrome c peroxidase